MCIMRVPDEGKEDRGAKSLLKEIMARTFQIQGKKDIQIHETHKIPNMRNPKQSASRHVIKLSSQRQENFDNKRKKIHQV